MIKKQLLSQLKDNNYSQQSSHVEIGIESASLSEAPADFRVLKENKAKEIIKELLYFFKKKDCDDEVSYNKQEYEINKLLSKLEDDEVKDD